MFIGRVAVQPESILFIDTWIYPTWAHIGTKMPLYDQYLSPESGTAGYQNRTLKAKTYSMARKEAVLLLERELY